MPKGQKECPKCGEGVGPRTKICMCGYEYEFKPAFLKNKTFNSSCHKQIQFNQLRRNDLVYVKQSSGPYWRSKEGEKISLGYSGKVKVRAIYEDGFSAWSQKEGCFAFIYMGPHQKSRNGVTTLSPHRIRKIF